MNNNDISTKNDNKQKESSSDDQLEPSNTLYYINKFQKILLDIDEKPDIMIEKILINIFNKYITPGNNEREYRDIDNCQKKIKVLCLKHEKHQIIYFLLTKIRSLIKKYREKILELPNIIELQDKNSQKYYPRSFSQNKKISNEYINFGTDRTFIINHRSIPKKKKNFDYYTTVKNLFHELKNIKLCLEKTAPIIEKIFELPLSEYDKFSIYECEKEDYLKILIHDSLIWNEILKNSKTQLNDIIEEITEDDEINLTSMTDKLDYFKKLQEEKKIKINEMLRIAPICSSIDQRFPEDARPVAEIKYAIRENFESFKNEEKSINFYQQNEDVDIDDYSNIDDQNIQNNDNINNIDEVAVFNKIKKNVISNKNSKEINEINIINNKINNINNISTINTLNIKEVNKYMNIPNLLKNNSEINTINTITNISKENFPKSIPFNKTHNLYNEINKINDKNKNNITREIKFK